MGSKELKREPTVQSVKSALMKVHARFTHCDIDPSIPSSVGEALDVKVCYFPSFHYCSQLESLPEMRYCRQMVV